MGMSVSPRFTGGKANHYKFPQPEIVWAFIFVCVRVDASKHQTLQFNCSVKNLPRARVNY
jgi:hypothetical protein